VTLSDPRPLLAGASAGGYAVGAFNVIQIEHAEAIVAGAERAGLPVVLQVSENTAAFHRGLAGIGAASLAIAAQATVPVVVHLDHAESEDLIDQAVALGFTSVMFDGAKLPYEQNQVRTAAVVARCHSAGVAVAKPSSARSAARTVRTPPGCGRTRPRRRLSLPRPGWTASR